jgi:hypothetical protein
MESKRNKFLTIIFSLLPGAGHMFMGFMKMGISLMAVFFFTIFLSSFFHTGEFLLILPIIWFYAFFHSINIAYCSDEDFSLLKDEYLFSLDKIMKVDKDLFKKRKLFAGILLILFGAYVVWDNIIENLSNVIPQAVYLPIYNILQFAPKMIIGIAIIFIGIRLIVEKKRESDIV